MNERLSLGGAILLGGRSSRFGGIPKALLEIDQGTTILDVEIAEMKKAFVEEIILVSSDPNPYSHLGLTVIGDLREGKGPLAGIEAVLDYYSTRRDVVFILPCDLPGMTVVEIEKMLHSFYSSSSGAAFAVTGTGEDDRHPLCCVLSVEHLSTVRDFIDRDVLRIWPVLKQIGAVPVLYEDPLPFFNINTPEDLISWRQAKNPAYGQDVRVKHVVSL